MGQGVSQTEGYGSPILSWLFQSVFSLQDEKSFWLCEAGGSWVTYQLSNIKEYHTDYKQFQS